MSDSLIQQDKQLTLIPSSEMPAAFFAKLEQRGEFTGERLWKQKPEAYLQVVSLSAEGHGQIKIGEILGVSPSTVRAVQKRERAAIDILKKAAADTALNVASLCFEEMYRRLCDPEERKKISFRDLAIGGAVMADKHGQLSGDIAARVDLSVQLEAGPQAFQEFLRTLNATGLGGNSAGQKEMGNVRPNGAFAGQASGLSAPPQNGPAAPTSGLIIDVPDSQSGVKQT